MRNGSCLHLASEHPGGFYLQTEEGFLRCKRCPSASPATS